GGVGMDLDDIGLVPGGVLDGIAIDDAPFATGTLYFSVRRGSAGVATGAGDVASEVAATPAGAQPQASADVFTSAGPACPGAVNTQVLDGDGIPLAATACYGGVGLGLLENAAAPGPPFADDLGDFDLHAPGVGIWACMYFSLAPGSPTLTGANPL